VWGAVLLATVEQQDLSLIHNGFPQLWKPLFRIRGKEGKGRSPFRRRRSIASGGGGMPRRKGGIDDLFPRETAAFGPRGRTSRRRVYSARRCPAVPLVEGGTPSEAHVPAQQSASKETAWVPAADGNPRGAPHPGQAAEQGTLPHLCVIAALRRGEGCHGVRGFEPDQGSTPQANR
jgi:hypothetical protein